MCVLKRKTKEEEREIEEKLVKDLQEQGIEVTRWQPGEEIGMIPLVGEFSYHHRFEFPVEFNLEDLKLSLKIPKDPEAAKKIEKQIMALIKMVKDSSITRKGPFFMEIYLNSKRLTISSDKNGNIKVEVAEGENDGTGTAVIIMGRGDFRMITIENFNVGA
jgi:hypothetical protein